MTSADADPRIQYERDGFVIFRRMFSAAEMERFVAEVQRNDLADQSREQLSVGAMRFWSNLFYTREIIRDFITQPGLIERLVPIIGPDFWVRWDQAVEKGPRSGVFAWHQDNGYNGFYDEHFQLWIALSPMTKENGGLWIVPGSHKRRLRHRRVGKHLEAVGTDIHDAPGAAKTFIAAEQGDVVLFSSLALHKTYENVTDAPRWAYVAEFMRSDCYDPAAARPYFNAARAGKPYPVFTMDLPASRNLRQRIRYLPKAIRLSVRERLRDRIAAAAGAVAP